MIFVESKKKSIKTILGKHPNASIIDVTSKGDQPWLQISPFYPHGGIPIPFSPGYYAFSVEGIWQGLKVFENQDIDFHKFEIKDMRGIKRTTRKYGKPLGHRKGVHGKVLLDYLTARKEIYLRCYGWVLENKANETIELLKREAEAHDLVLLDYETNGNIDNIRKPLSHAALVKRYLEKKYPELISISFSTLQTTEKEKRGDRKKKKKNEILNRTEQLQLL
jgi:hypothetical protein